MNNKINNHPTSNVNGNENKMVKDIKYIIVNFHMTIEKEVEQLIISKMNANRIIMAIPFSRQNAIN